MGQVLASRLAVAFAASCLAACVHIEHPPASWGNFTSNTPSDDCVSLGATYDNKGNKPDGTAVLLATWLNPRNGWPTPDTRAIETDIIRAQTVSLALDGALLTIQASGTAAIRQWSFDKSKGEFACRNGVLHISKGGDMSGDDIAAVGSEAIDLYRTQSHLIVNSHGGSAGIALLIPMAEYGSAWARFPVHAGSVSQAAPPQ